jgi:hypothetical protein
MKPVGKASFVTPLNGLAPAYLNDIEPGSTGFGFEYRRLIFGKNRRLRHPTKL